MAFVELTFGLTAEKLLRNSVDRFQPTQRSLVLATRIVYRSEKFSDEAPVDPTARGPGRLKKQPSLQYPGTQATRICLFTYLQFCTHFYRKIPIHLRH